MKETAKQQIKAALWSVLAVGLSALLSMLFTDTGSAWYTSLNMPAFMPPPLVFAIVWSVFYPLLAVVLQRQIMRKNHRTVWGFAVVLTLCALWSYAFFVLQNSLAGLVLLILCLVSLVYIMRPAWQTDRLSLAVLLPFTGWIAFAMAINYYIYMAN